MSLAKIALPIADRLEYALGAGKLPPHMLDWGRQLLSHLRKPVQVVIMGLPGSGKSTLVNMLAGEEVIPRKKSIPVIEIAGGPETRVVFEIEDGSMERRPGTLGEGPIPEGTVRARQELPDPDLKRQNFVEVDLTGNFGYQKSIVNWVVQWADIVLWCTPEFDDAEQELWASVPDEIKDRSFLVLTMADQQMMRGTLVDRIKALEDLVAEEFLGLYPLATIQAIAARSAGAVADPRLWKSSGGKELLDSVLRQVEIGRAADMDRADMLLSRFAPEIAPMPVVPDPRRKTRIQDDGTKARNSDRPPSDHLSDALDLLQSRADVLLATMSGQSEPDPNAVLARCVETANALMDVLNGADPDNPTVREVQEDAEESAEMMLLFQLEKGEDAAADAVTLLLQLKKELAQLDDK